MRLIFSFSLSFYSTLYCLISLKRTLVVLFFHNIYLADTLSVSLSQLLPILILALEEKLGKHEGHTKSDQKLYLYRDR